MNVDLYDTTGTSPPNPLPSPSPVEHADLRTSIERYGVLVVDDRRTGSGDLMSVVEGLCDEGLSEDARLPLNVDNHATGFVESPVWIDLPEGTAKEKRDKRATRFLYSELADLPDQAQYLSTLRATAKVVGISPTSLNHARVLLGTTDYQDGRFDPLRPARAIRTVISLKDGLSVKVGSVVCGRKWHQFGQGSRNVPPDLSTNPLYASAVAWGFKRRPVFPLIPGTKKPLTTNGFQDASDDPALIDRQWMRTPNANVGMATGNGLVVLDLDVKRGIDGIANWEAICQEHGFDWKDTLLVNTPSGGMHAYYYDASGYLSTCHKEGTVLEGVGGIDLRGQGGYVVVAPSVLGEYDGKAYEVLNPGMPIATMPQWFYGASDSLGVRRKANFEVAEVDAMAQQLHREYVPILGKRWGGNLTAMIARRKSNVDRSQLTLNIVRSAVQQHLDLAMIYETLKDPINPGGEKLREDIANLGEKAGRKRFDDAVDGAFRLQAERLLELRELRATLRELDIPVKVTFPSRTTGELMSCTRTSILKGIEGVLAIAERNRTVSPMLGTWDMTTSSGFGSKDTARKVLLALEWLGIVTTPHDLSCGQGQQAFVYTILDGSNPPRTVGQVVRVNQRATSDPQLPEEYKRLEEEHKRRMTENNVVLKKQAPTTTRKLGGALRKAPNTSNGDSSTDIDEAA